MTGRRLCFTAAAAVWLAGAAIAFADPSPAPSGGTVPGGFGVTRTHSDESSVGVTPPSERIAAQPVVRTVDCGPTAVEGSPLSAAYTACAAVHPICDVATSAAL